MLMRCIWLQKLSLIRTYADYWDLSSVAIISGELTSYNGGLLNHFHFYVHYNSENKLKALYRGYQLEPILTVDIRE